jgi:tryptophanyl-tRNA synthetase
VGSLLNRVQLQEAYRCFFLVADLHALTTHAEQTRDMSRNTLELVLDWLSVGLDPSRSTFYVQSHIPAVSELFTVLSMLCTVPRAQRIPALKDLAKDENYSIGLLAYPVLMAADILLFKGAKVPVGEDQLSHIELARELARRFNRLYGNTFPEPEAIVSRTPRLVGIDGFRKMSKSLDNAIYLSDDPRAVDAAVARMYTDPKRIHASTPGTVEGNPLFVYHDLFNSNQAQVEDLKQRYRNGRVGDVEVKRLLAEALNAYLDPIRARRAHYTLDQAGDILRDGTRQARELAETHWDEIARRLGLFTP